MWFHAPVQGIEELWQRYGERGLVVLGFPCNQFGGQEPDSEAQIATFCERRFGVSFPLFAKVEVNGGDAHPLFIELKKRAPGLLGSKAIKWNFTKFLISDQGRTVRRYSSRTAPQALAADIEALLWTTSGAGSIALQALMCGPASAGLFLFWSQSWMSS